MSDIQTITAALAETGKSRIVVLGDYALDKYLYIDPKRDEPSVETGLTAYQIHDKRMSAGAHPDALPYCHVYVLPHSYRVAPEAFPVVSGPVELRFDT